MGNAQAYRDRTANGQPRTDQSPAGYVPGGPATGGTEGWYDCDNLRNDSPNNTGLVELPHDTGTGMDAGKVRPREPLVQPRQSRLSPTAAQAIRGTAAPTPGRRTTAVRRPQLCPYLSGTRA